MPESDLSLTYDDLKAEVGFYLGFGRSSSSWTEGQEDSVTSMVDAGLRQFYNPPPLPGEDRSHEWTFLRPIGTIGLAPGRNTFRLPNDFAGLDGPLTFTDTTIRTAIQIIGEPQVRQMTQGAGITGVPMYGAVVPQPDTPQIGGGTTTLRVGQQFSLMVFPQPDRLYTVQYRYNVLPSIPTTDYASPGRPLPLGGMSHAETILAACLAVAERRMNDDRGVMWEGFIERLRASVSTDRNQMVPHGVGYMGDPSGDDGTITAAEYRRMFGGPNVTVGGVSY